jgi:hypothetical protein
MLWNEACDMALHRDIFWIGRQWSVTGSGMQVINQKYDGEYDIPIECLWDDGLTDSLREQQWFNPDDFNKGLVVARARYPRPRHEPTALPPAVPAVEAPPVVALEAVPEAVKPPTPAPSFLEMRIPSHSAKLLRIWRARGRR